MERSHLRKACLLLAIVLSVALTSCRLAPAERADVLPGQGPTPEAGGPGRGHVDHFVAMKNGKVAGRLEAGGGYLEAFKDNVETFEVTFPHDFYEVRFPTEMQKTELKDPPAVPNAFSPEAFYAIWMDARYPELFNETLRCDGWKSESMAFVLMTRFDQDPLGFLRALSRAYTKEVERVGDLLVYYADYQDLDAFRQRIESLRKETSDQGELRTLDVILQSIEEFKRGGL